jgi:hypothetical protein
LKKNKFGVWAESERVAQRFKWQPWPVGPVNSGCGLAPSCCRPGLLGLKGQWAGPARCESARAQRQHGAIGDDSSAATQRLGVNGEPHQDKAHSLGKVMGTNSHQRRVAVERMELNGGRGHFGGQPAMRWSGELWDISCVKRRA